jgi:hypothetical protein
VVFRQSDKLFVKFLDELRLGALTAEGRQYLKQLRNVSEVEFTSAKCIKLYTTNQAVEEYNAFVYESNKRGGRVFTGIDRLLDPGYRVEEACTPLNN